jgi:hypothetical protein
MPHGLEGILTEDTLQPAKDEPEIEVELGMIETKPLFIEHMRNEDLQQHPFVQLQLVLPRVVPTSLVLL